MGGVLLQGVVYDLPGRGCRVKRRGGAGRKMPRNSAMEGGIEKGYKVLTTAAER